MLGFVVVLAATRLRHATGAVQAAGITLLVFAGLVLVVSPAPSAPKPPQPKARLSVSQLLVTGGTNLFEPVKLDITVHNLGNRLAVLTGLRIKILDFAYMRDCYTQGEIDASKPYPLSLPDNPAAGTVMTVPLHEEVGHDQVDRFVVRLWPPPFRKDKYGTTQEGTFVYRVAGTLSSDVQKDLALGSASFAVPFTPGLWNFVWNTADPDRRATFANKLNSGQPMDWSNRYMRPVETCLDKNSSSLARLLHPAGARSDEMAELLSAIEPR